MDNTPISQSTAVPGQNEDLPDELQAIARRYTVQPVPRPAGTETASLVRLLLAEARLTRQESRRKEHKPLWQICAVARWRVLLLGPWFWIIGVLLLILPLSSIWLNSSRQESTALYAHRAFSVASIDRPVLLLVLVLPLSAMLGLAYALRTPSPGLRAVEASCPVSFLQTALGLALAVLAFACLLGLLATLEFALVSWEPFWNLLLAWLTPLLVLTAISLPLALLRGVRAALLVGGLPWLFLGIGALAEQNAPGPANWLFALPQEPLDLLFRLILSVISLAFLLILFLSAPKWQRFCAF
jgi:hypothetical protein